MTLGVIAFWQLVVEEKGISRYYQQYSSGKFVVLENGAGNRAALNNLVCAICIMPYCFITSVLSCKAELAPHVLVSEQFLPSGKFVSKEPHYHLMQVEALLCSC